MPFFSCWTFLTHICILSIQGVWCHLRGNELQLQLYRWFSPFYGPTLVATAAYSNSHPFPYATSKQLSNQSSKHAGAYCITNDKAFLSLVRLVRCDSVLGQQWILVGGKIQITPFKASIFVELLTITYYFNFGVSCMCRLYSSTIPRWVCNASMNSRLKSRLCSMSR